MAEDSGWVGVDSGKGVLPWSPSGSACVMQVAVSRNNHRCLGDM